MAVVVFVVLQVICCVRSLANSVSRGAAHFIRRSRSVGWVAGVPDWLFGVAVSRYVALPGYNTTTLISHYILRCYRLT